MQKNHEMVSNGLIFHKCNKHASNAKFNRNLNWQISWRNYLEYSIEIKEVESVNERIRDG